MLRAVSELSDNSEIMVIIKQHSMYRGKGKRSEPLTRKEHELNEISFAICSRLPQLLFHRQELTTLARRVFFKN